MRKLTAFEQVTLDGFFSDERGDTSFFHRHDPEWAAFVEENARGGGELLFGRKTYEQMASFWPTAQAKEALPEVAARMNAMKKTVFSRTLREASWEGTTLFHDDLPARVRALKASEGPDVAVMGSGSIVSALVAEGLLDALTIVVVPLVLGRGRPLFSVDASVALSLVGSRSFANGNVVSTYVSKASR